MDNLLNMLLHRHIDDFLEIIVAAILQLHFFAGWDEHTFSLKSLKKATSSLDVEVMLTFVLHHFWHVHNFLLVKKMLSSTFGGDE